MFLGGLIMTKYLLNEDVDTSCDEEIEIPNNSNFIYPNIIDYRDFCLPTNNQGNTPHCVGYTVGGYLEVEYWKRFHIPKQFNAEKLYRSGRIYKPDTINGTKIEYVLKQLKKDNLFSGFIISFKCKTIDNLKYIIHQYGCVMCALTITDEWYNLDSDYVIKANKKRKILGGHCVLCPGYCQKGIHIQNSWGYKKWGNYGFAILPWKLLLEQFDYGVFVKRFNFHEEYVRNFLNESTS